jgi:membrane-associated phospholipid phosphatase
LWTGVIGLPVDPIQIFLWCWLGSVAWNAEAGWRHHLRFPRDWSAPLVVLLMYTWTRGIADGLGQEVSYTTPILVDTWLGAGQLPTTRLQDALCDGRCDGSTWFDPVLAAVYVSHFVVAATLAAVLYQRSRNDWADWMRRWLTLGLAGLVCYVVYPMSPPWLASLRGYTDESFTRVTGSAWDVLGIDLARLLVGPGVNLVAAMPSLHAALAMLVASYGIERTARPARWFLLAYPALMAGTLIYFGEHYLIDVLAGIALAVAVNHLWRRRGNDNTLVLGQGGRKRSPGTPAIAALSDSHRRSAERGREGASRAWRA